LIFTLTIRRIPNELRGKKSNIGASRSPKLYLCKEKGGGWVEIIKRATKGKGARNINIKALGQRPEGEADASCL